MRGLAIQNLLKCTGTLQIFIDPHNILIYLSNCIHTDMCKRKKKIYTFHTPADHDSYDYCPQYLVLQICIFSA